MKRMFNSLSFLLFSVIAFSQDDFKYQLPPKDIADLVLAKPTPGVSIDDKAEWMLLLERSDFPTIEELAQPELRIAGLRINPNNFGPSRAASSNNIQLKKVETGQVFQITGLPKDLKASSVQWSPDQKQFAFVHSGNTALDLYVVDINTKKARKINRNPLNSVLGGSYQWVNNSQLIYKTIVPGKKLTAKAGAPAGPVVQENLGKAAASRTYQDLIRNTYDEALFDYYATAQLVKNDLKTEMPVGKPAIYRSFSISPDKSYLLTTTINRPFSYLVPANGFPHTVAITDMNGKLVRTLATNPSSEGQPIGFDDVAIYPRSFDWRDDQPSTVTYVQALDNGLGKSKAPYRDALYSISVKENGQAKELLKTKRRFGGIVWGSPDLAVFYERMFADRRIRMNRYNPSTGMIDSLHERSSNDSYNDIGTPVTVRNKFGRQTLVILNGKELLLRSQGSSAEGDFPLLQSFDVITKERNLLWRAEAPYYETVVDVLDPVNQVILTMRESITDVPNYYILNLKKQAKIKITDFKNPYALLEGVKKEKITYKREDGISLTGDLYLPKNYDPKKDGPLPVIVWAYPIEYKSATDAAQVRGSKYRFTRVNYGGPSLWVTQGYAVLDNAEMPIVGEAGKEPNDNFIPQLHLNAHAAIKKLSDMGVGDSNRVAVGGHSYGAFMTANLLAHTKLFKAGIARSGAYNRTLTPFGFQAEERTYWEAPEIYHQMSPFTYANQIKTPILLIHGELDNNSGTFPIQSERLYNAIKGHGGTVRYVVLPYESHGYAAKENILHMLWEQNQWLEKWVKNADKNKPADGKNRTF